MIFGWRSDGRSLLILPACLEAVHLGHLEVHEDKVVVAGLEGVDGLEAVADGVRVVAHPLEEPKGDLLVHRVVLGHEHVERDLLGDRAVLLARLRHGPACRSGSRGIERAWRNGTVLIGLETVAYGMPVRRGRGGRLAEAEEHQPRALDRPRLLERPLAVELGKVQDDDRRRRSGALAVTSTADSGSLANTQVAPSVSNRRAQARARDRIVLDAERERPRSGRSPRRAAPRPPAGAAPRRS